MGVPRRRVSRSGSLGKGCLARGPFRCNVEGEKALRKYIQEQEKQDQIEDKVSTKEYENPFKGNAR